MKVLVKSMMAILLSFSMFSLTACWESETENKMEDVGEAMEDTADDAQDAVEDAAEKTEESAEEMTE